MAVGGSQEANDSEHHGSGFLIVKASPIGPGETARRMEKTDGE